MTTIAITIKIPPNWGNIPNAAPVLVIKVKRKILDRVGNRLQESPCGIFWRTRNLLA
jgi:hypothetical protein